MRKLFLFIAALLTATVMNLQAANVDTLYLNTGGSTLWNQGGAKFSVFYWNDGMAGKFTDFLELAYGETDIYRAIIPKSDSVIFVRHAATADVPSWDNKLHYTKGEKVDLEDNGNIMVVNGWEPADLEWDNYTPKQGPDMHDYLHFVSLKASGSVKMSKQGTPAQPVLEYSKDNRKSWSNFDLGNGTTFDHVGDTIWFRAGKNGVAGTNATISSSMQNYYTFAFGANDSIAAGGNIMSLYDASCEQTTMTSYGFVKLFQNAKQLVSAPELPATQLAQDCYYQMFSGCTALTAAPKMKATTVANLCCYAMFNGCTSLIQAPELKATTLAENCYSQMFYGCTSLTQAPALPATKLAELCYTKMFYGCTSLAQAPELKATTLANFCYMSMFQGCTSLQVDAFSNSCNGAELVVPDVTGDAPDDWNYNMFNGCHGTAANNIQLGGHYCIKEYVPYQIIVTYDLQGHGTAIKNDTIISGSKLTRPADPEAKGFEFRNWYTDAQSSGKAFDFSKAVTADKDTTITLYAKWRDSVAWEQFQDSLDKYSYVEYDSTYEAGFIIHLATTQDAQVQPLKDAAFIEASEDVLANYDFAIFTKALLEEYTLASDELNKCLGIEEYAPMRRRPKQNYFLQLISAYTQLPYRVNGLNAVGGLFSSYVDLVYKAWAETNYENDAELCKCMFNSDVFFKGNARIMAAFDACEK